MFFFWFLAHNSGKEDLGVPGAKHGRFLFSTHSQLKKKKKLSLRSVDFPAIFKFNQIGFHDRKYLPISPSLPTVLSPLGRGFVCAGPERRAVRPRQYRTWSQACDARTPEPRLFSLQMSLSAPTWKNPALGTRACWLLPGVKVPHSSEQKDTFYFAKTTFS